MDLAIKPIRVTGARIPFLTVPQFVRNCIISALYKPRVCKRPLLHFGLNSGIPVIAARVISDIVRFTNKGHVCGYEYNETNYVHSKEAAFLACAEL